MKFVKYMDSKRLYNKECLGKIVIDDKMKASIDSYYEKYGVQK